METRQTEQNSKYRHLETKTIQEIIHEINHEDHSVAKAVQTVLPNVQALIEALVPKLKSGGRLFYIGAGTSGRLGILDASECPPTFGVSPDLVIGLIAGGDKAIRKAVEFAEDDRQLAYRELKQYHISPSDFVIGIAASGTTPYVLGGIEMVKNEGILTGCITCNPGSPLGQLVDYSIEVATGPEYLTGSTRMKAGTAQKMILNMITTTTMIQLGRVKDNKMVDMQLSNNKLIDRGIRQIMEFDPTIDYQEANLLINRYGSVRHVLNYLKQK